MNKPVLTYELDTSAPHAYAELDEVRVLIPLKTDDGADVAAGSEGTVLAIWAKGAAYEVEFDAGLATVPAENLASAL